jgi:hypothetical protein
LFRPVKTWSRAAAGGLPPPMSEAAMVSIPSLAAARPFLAVATAVLTAGSLDHTFRTMYTRWHSLVYLVSILPTEMSVLARLTMIFARFRLQALTMLLRSRGADEGVRSE